MKKSLSLLLALAMVFSAFASVASAAETELTTQQKYDELKAKGIFAGMADGSAGLDKNMNRAQFARVAALILGLEGIGNPDTKVVTEQPFPDVALTHWAVEEITAAKEAGIMRGNADGTFNPNGNITVQELAVVTAGLLELDPVEGATVEGAAAWAAGYIQAILDAGISFPTNYTEPAIRSQLVDVAYQADQVINPVEPAKVSVVEAKATGVKKVEVKLDKAVDTSKATLTLKKGSTTVATETKWAEDGKSAVLTLKDSAKITGDTYTVTLGGIDADTIATASAQFTAQDETVTKIEFVTASEQIAASPKAKIKVRPENQYGEIASFNASSYTVNALSLNPSVKKDSEGYLIITMNTVPDTTNNLLRGVSIIPVYVSFDNNRVTASKNFTLGTEPFVMKMELGEVKYSNNAERISVPGETATVVLNLFDQYGNPFTPEQETATSKANINAFLSPYAETLKVDWSDTSNDEYKVKVSINSTNDSTKKIEKNQDYTLTVFAGGASQTATIKVGSAKLAMKVKIGDPTSELAAGDAGVKYINLDVYDAEGNLLTAQEIVDNKDRIRVTVSGNTGGAASVETTGKNKGKIKFSGVPVSENSFIFVTASITTPNAQSFDTKQFKVEPQRVPDHIEVKSKPAVKGVANAESEFELKVVDQYGDEIDTFGDPANKGNHYDVKVRLVNSNAALTTTVTHNSVTYSNNTTFVGVGAQDNFTVFNDNKFKFVLGSGAVLGTARFEVQLLVSNASVTDNIIDTETVTIETIDPKSYLVYALKDLGTIYGAKDIPSAYGSYTNYASVIDRDVELKVTDGAGNSVAVPSGLVQFAVSSAPGVAQIQAGNTVLGWDAGEATVTATVYGVDGVTRTLSTKVTVKEDPIVVKEISSNDEIQLTNGTTLFANGANGVRGKLDLKIKDQYGNEFSGDDIFGNYAPALALSFSITDIVGTGGVQLNFSGSVPTSITVDAGVQGFTLNIVSADGSVDKSVAVIVN